MQTSASTSPSSRSTARRTPRSFGERVDATFAALLADPTGFRSLFAEDPTLRHVLHGRIRKQPNHLFFFRIDGDDITVIRVLHGSRDDLGAEVAVTQG